jgi:hypothetical protein
MKLMDFFVWLAACRTYKVFKNNDLHFWKNEFGPILLKY